jgi:hypothetical protein
MESGDAEAITHNNEQGITQIHVSFFFSHKFTRNLSAQTENMVEKQHSHKQQKL